MCLLKHILSEANRFQQIYILLNTKLSQYSRLSSKCPSALARRTPRSDAPSLLGVPENVKKL